MRIAIEKHRYVVTGSNDRCCVYVGSAKFCSVCDEYRTAKQNKQGLHGRKTSLEDFHLESQNNELDSNAQKGSGLTKYEATRVKHASL